MTKVSANLAKEAKAFIKSETATVSGATKIVRAFLNLKSIKAWADAAGFNAQSFDKKGRNTCDYWGVYDRNGRAVQLETIYEVDENCEFVYDTIEYTVGSKTYRKSQKRVAFYRYSEKKRWTPCDVIDAYTKYANEVPVEYVDAEVPFLKEKGKLVPSTDPEHIRRATDAAQKAEREQRIANQATEE